MSENTRNKIKSYGHRNLDRAVDSATFGLANKLSTGSGRKRKGKGLLLGKNSPFNKIPINRCNFIKYINIEYEIVLCEAKEND